MDRNAFKDVPDDLWSRVEGLMPPGLPRDPMGEDARATVLGEGVTDPGPYCRECRANAKTRSI